MLRGVSMPSPILPHTIGCHGHILCVHPGEFRLQLGGGQQGHLHPFIPGMASTWRRVRMIPSP